MYDYTLVLIAIIYRNRHWV